MHALPVHYALPTHCACTLCSYAFGLEETNFRGKAEEVAREALAMNQKTPFASHAMGEAVKDDVM